MTRLQRPRRAVLVSVLLASIVHANDGGLWLDRAPMNIPRQEVGAARIGDRVYVVGGLLAGFPLSVTNTVEAYDFVRDAWSFVASMPAARDHMAVAASGGRLFVMGGFSADFQARADVYSYDPGTDVWTTVSPLPQARGGCWAVELGGKIYLFGGVDSADIAQSTTYIYDVAGDSWTQGADMPTPREHLTAAVVGDFIYVIGGRNPFPLASNERYHPATNQWTLRAPMPTARSATATAAIGTRIMVAGGEIPMLFDVNEVYDATADAWSCGAAMPIPRHGIAAVALDDRVLTPAGGTVQGLAPTAALDSFVFDDDVVPLGCGSNPIGSMRHLSGTPSPGSTLVLGLDNPLGTQAIGSLPLLALALDPDPNFPCGTPIAGLGMGGAGSIGELSISVAPPNPLLPILVGSPWTGPGNPAPVPINIANDPSLVGLTAFAQGLIFDPFPPQTVKFGLTEAVRIRLVP